MGRPLKVTTQTSRDPAAYRYWEKNKQQAAVKHAIYRVNLKLEVLTHYSPSGILRCSWSGCAVNDVDMLTLGHLDRNRRGTGIALYQALCTEGFPLGFQTLCCNHNQKKETMRSRGL